MGCDDLICETCGAPVTQNVHGEFSNTCTATIRDLQAQNAKLRKALGAYEAKVREYASDNPAVSDCAYDWMNEDAGQTARAALEDTP